MAKLPLLGVLGPEAAEIYAALHVEHGLKLRMGVEGAVMHTLQRGRWDFDAVTMTVPSRYEVVVDEEVAGEAARLLADAPQRRSKGAPKMVPATDWLGAFHHVEGSGYRSWHERRLPDRGNRMGRPPFRKEPAMNVNARAALWRTAANDLRRRPAGGEHDPGEYALFGISRLLDALAGSLERKDELRDEVLSAADDLSRHIHHYIPKPDE